jgi:hypothetical protein
MLNPPFGHSGEKRLEECFLCGMVKYKEISQQKEWQDLIDLKVCNGFTVLTEEADQGIEGGLTHFRYLGTCKCIKKKVCQRNLQILSPDKKYGFFSGW